MRGQRCKIERVRNTVNGLNVVSTDYEEHPAAEAAAAEQLMMQASMPICALAERAAAATTARVAILANMFE